MVPAYLVITAILSFANDFLSAATHVMLRGFGTGAWFVSTLASYVEISYFGRAYVAKRDDILRSYQKYEVEDKTE